MNKMKTIILSLTLMFFICSCNVKNGSPVGSSKGDTTIFHIKVKNHGSDCFFYGVYFTNDNFVTEEPIMDVLDNSFGAEVIVYHQLILFTNTGSAVKFAARFKDYNSCIRYNDTVKMRFEKTLKRRELEALCKQTDILVK